MLPLLLKALEMRFCPVLLAQLLRDSALLAFRRKQESCPSLAALVVVMSAGSVWFKPSSFLGIVKLIPLIGPAERRFWLNSVSFWLVPVDFSSLTEEYRTGASEPNLGFTMRCYSNILRWPSLTLRVSKSDSVIPEIASHVSNPCSQNWWR